MNRMRREGGLAIVVALCLLMGNVLCANAQGTQAQQQSGQASGQAYTVPEYNAYTACAAEKNDQAIVKCLDDFVAKYPNSALLVYVYQLYLKAYGNLKNYPKVIENADKLAAMGDKLDALTLFNAYYLHAAAYNALISDPASKGAATDVNLAKGAEAAVANGLKTLDKVQKPQNVADDAWATQKKQSQIFLNGVAAQAAIAQKNYPAAIGYDKALLAMNPDEPSTWYDLGRAYLASTPPQQLDAFWAIARASAKDTNAQEAGQMKTYLRKLVVNYQQGGCDSLTDAQLNEMVQLAGSSADRPASYTLPSANDLNAARQNMTIASVIADLKAKGDKAKTTWLAACGSEFPDVPGKVIDIVPGSDAIELKEAFVTSEEEFNNATVADMDIKVVGQPEAAKIEKGSAARFTATLASYDPEPFMLHWDKAKVNSEDIPKEKEKTPARRRPGASQ